MASINENRKLMVENMKKVKSQLNEDRTQLNEFEYMESDLEDLENAGENTYNEKIELDVARNELIDFLSKSLNRK